MSHKSARQLKSELQSKLKEVNLRLKEIECFKRKIEFDSAIQNQKQRVKLSNNPSTSSQPKITIFLKPKGGNTLAEGPNGGAKPIEDRAVNTEGRFLFKDIYLILNYREDI